MHRIDPKEFNTTGTELSRFSSVFSTNCNRQSIGWNFRQSFILKNFAPHTYFETYQAIGQYIRTTTQPELPKPEKI